MTESHRELMRLHVEALFVHDADQQLVRVNVPDGAAPPRVFLGRTTEGVVLRYRADVSEDVRRELEAVSRESIALDSPPSITRYETILGRSAPIQKTWTGPAFSFPSSVSITHDVVRIVEQNQDLLEPLLPEWIPDVGMNPPVVGLLVDGRAVAVCCSVRRTDSAHEAGVETHPRYRGCGYAASVVAAWAQLVRDMNRVPLYSTSWQNDASRAVARKLSLIQFGSDIHIT
jgi:hypothetical protein